MREEEAVAALYRLAAGRDRSAARTGLAIMAMASPARNTFFMAKIPPSLNHAEVSIELG